MGGGPALTGAMCCVCLPEPFTGDQTAADKLRWQLADTFEVQVPLRSINGRFWARLSAQIYNDMDDYHRFAKAILKLQQQ
jgi:selenocysteine lyase/cysteine desulfurase